MKHFKRLTLIAVVIAVSAMAASPPEGVPTDKDPAAYKGLSKEDIDRIWKNEVVILDHPETVQGRQMITAALIFNQDIETVWNLMTQGWRQEEYLPRLKNSELVEKWDGGDKLRMHVEVLGVKINYQIIGTRDKSKYHSHWKLDPEFKNDMREVTGFWRFYWIDEKHTLARYGTWVETGLWIPPKVQAYMTKQDLPDALGTQKKWVDSGGTYVKEGYKPDK